MSTRRSLLSTLHCVVSLLNWQLFMIWYEGFTHIFLGCFTGIDTILWPFRYGEVTLKDMGKINQTTWQDDKGKRGAYLLEYTWVNDRRMCCPFCVLLMLTVFLNDPVVHEQCLLTARHKREPSWDGNDARWNELCLPYTHHSKTFDTGDKVYFHFISYICVVKIWLPCYLETLRIHLWSQKQGSRYSR